MDDGQAAAVNKPDGRVKKALIVNGDDFGLSPEVNAGIVKAHRNGILNSASLMVSEPGRDEAARAAKELPGLDVGLHLVVCLGRSTLPAARIAPLVNQSGEFVRNPVIGGMRYFFDRSIRSRLADECRAQVEEHMRLVGYLNHIDGHLNFHVHPVLADIMVALAAEYKVPCIRLPREDAMATLALARDHMLRKMVESVIFRSLSRRTRRLARERGIKSTDWLFGLHQSGHLSEEYILGVIDKLRGGVTELYFHPAMDVGGVPPKAAAQLEVEILTSPRVREALDSRAIRLTTYADLARSQP